MMKRNAGFSVPILLFAPFFLLPALWAKPLPPDIEWTTNDRAPLFASSQAKKGGTYRTSITSFPLTLRTVGPDSNTGIRPALLGNQMGLLDLHPNREEWIPSLATHWAVGADRKTMYYKIDKRARWSDGEPVTTDDFVFGLEFMRSKHILAPWYNNRFSNDFDRIVKQDDYTFAVILKKPKPDLEYYAGFLPQPRHYYQKLNENFVRDYNWKIVPNTGPYRISKIEKGKSITFRRNKNWWARDLRYNRGRFNVDKVIYRVIRESATTLEYFKKHRLDDYDITSPKRWHQETENLEIFDKGYAKKMWFFTDSPQPMLGIFLNEDKELFKDRNVRYAFAHAMNMDKLLNGLLRGDYRRLHSDTTGYGEYTNPSIRAREFDIDRAEGLLTASGWERGEDGIWRKEGRRFSLNLSYSLDYHTERVVLLKEEAKKAGIELKLKKFDSSTFYKLVMEKKHDAAWMGWGASWRPQYWGQFHSVNAHKPKTNNITNTDDPEMDRLIEIYRNSLNVEQRKKTARRIQRKIFEIGSYVPTYKVGYFRTAFWRWWKFPDPPATKLSDQLFEPFSVGIFWMDAEERERTLAAMKAGRAFEPETILDRTFLTDSSR